MTAEPLDLDALAEWAPSNCLDGGFTVRALIDALREARAENEELAGAKEAHAAVWQAFEMTLDRAEKAEARSAALEDALRALVDAIRTHAVAAVGANYRYDGLPPVFVDTARIADELTAARSLLSQDPTP